MIDELGGILPALVTPLQADGTPDLAALPGVLDHVLASGVAGIVALGGQGEHWALTEAEHLAVAGAVVEHVGGRVPVVVGASGETTRLTARLVAQATRAGADAVLVMPPAMTSLREPELEGHIRSLARGSALPLVLYNHPARAGTAFSVDLLARLSRSDGILGVKDSSGSLTYLLQVLARVEDGFRVLCGHDALIGASVLGGAHGAIASTGNVVPGLLVALYEAARRGDATTAFDLQRRVLALRTAFELGTFPVVMKEALALSGLPVGPAAAPVAALDPAARTALAEVLDAVAVPSR